MINEQITSPTRVFTDKKDLTLSQIKEMFDDGDIISQPDYQRDYVMDEKTASRLIESVLMNIPIPTVYLCEESDGRLSIIDGQQRMTSFVKFLKNEFSLRGLEELNDLNGKKYADLEKALQRTLKSCTLNSIILTKESQELKYEIFARLNQGSIRLKPQELRNCIYRGSLNDLLEEIASNNRILKDLFIDENKRKNYQEYILRFFALRNFQEYSSSMNKTMNNFMAMYQNADEDKIKELKDLFNRTVDIIKQVFGNNAFCAYDRQKGKYMNKFSGSVYDSIIVACSMFDNHDLMSHADNIRDCIQELKKNDIKYQDFTYAATGSKNRVIGRIMMVYNAIANVIGKHSNAGIIRTFSDEIKNELWHDGYVCSFCGQKILSIDDAEVDHIRPFSQGGETTLENAQLLHRHCNRVKNDNDFESVNVNEIELDNSIDDSDEREE